MDNLYHIITHSDDSGWDEKPESKTKKDAINKAKTLIQDPYYDEVKIFRYGILIRHYYAIYQRKIITLK